MVDVCDTCKLALYKGDQVMRIHGVIVHARVNCAWKTALKYGPSRNVPAETYHPPTFSPPSPPAMRSIGSILKDIFK